MSPDALTSGLHFNVIGITMANNNTILINTDNKDHLVLDKAICVAIRYHFCDVDNNEREIFDALAYGDIIGDVWQPFENYEADELYSCIEGLVDDMVSMFTFKTI